MTKKLLCSILVIIFVFFAVPFYETYGASDTMTTLVSLVNRFPQGKYWNHIDKANDPNSVTSTPCAGHSNCSWVANACDCNSFDNAIQCMGYAHKISYEITGVMPRNNYLRYNSLNAADLRVGDIIRYRWNGHSICVTGVSGNKISFTDCNYVGRCQIRWGIMDLSEIVGFSYVLRLKGNTRKNSDLDFYENVDGYTAGVNEKASFERWTTKDDVINIRSTRKTTANIIGKLPTDTEINIYDKYYDGKYIWGKVVYGNLMGWCVLNYSEYIDGVIERPNLKNTKETYNSGEDIKLNWKEVSGATKYIVAVYNSDGERVKRYELGIANTSKTITIKTADKYTAKVVATSSLIPSWRIESKLYNFEVESGDKVKVESVSFSAPSKLAVGSSTTLEATVEPAWATDCSVAWKSSNTSVATVNSNGKITAKKIGEVTITCTSADNSNITYSQKLFVIPDSVKDLTQSSSASGTALIKWSEISGADYYDIYVYNSESDKYEKAGTSKTESYTISDTAGKICKVKVRAAVKISSKTYYGEFSDIFEAVTGPEAPKLTANPGTDSILLNWNKISGATQYVLYRIVDGEKVKIATIDADDTDYRYLVEDVEADEYTYRIRAIKNVGSIKGYGSYSKAVSVTIE